MTIQATDVATDSFPVRRVSFADPLQNLPKHFALDENLVLSHLAVQLSALFPAGEDFFVRSVRAYRSELHDPELKKQVSSFIGQESIHGREHREMNERFDALGYRTSGIDSRLDKRLHRMTERQPAILCLAITAAIEHFTAVLAEVMLDTDGRTMLGHPGIQSIFLWHALEESEHKAVAFDVYRTVGGTEKMRIKTMRAIRRAFIGRTASLTVLSILRDRETYRRGRLLRDLRAARKAPLFDRTVWRSLCDYDRAGFHPNDHETSHLVERWREELFGTNGTLTAYVAT